MQRSEVTRLDFEDADAQVRRDLVADAHAVAHQIEERENQRNPQHQIFVDEAVEVLIEKQQAGAQKRHVVKSHLTLGHVSHH